METHNNKSFFFFFFPLMKVIWMLYFCFSFEGTKANTQFHTLQISSLLPADLCTPSTASGSSKKQSTLQVIHKHGPCSHLTQDKSSTTTTAAAASPPLSEILTHDQSRVESIQSKLKPNSKKPNKLNEKKTNIPAQSGKSLGSGNYVIVIGLGTPKKTLTLIFDTGSDLMWTQCQPCARSCYTQKDAIFNPSLSSSYSNISCSSAQCSLLTSATGNNPGCTAAATCVYGIQYGDKSFSVGFFAKDTLTITPNDVFPNFLFGCGQNNQGLFGNTGGLLGLGRDSLSLVSQTSQKYGKYFSYCLPSTSSSTGHLTLGKNNGGGAALTSSTVQFTPFATSQGTSFYFIDIVSISVGGAQLPIGQSVFKTAGAIIDSGTVISRLPPAAYSAMSSAFRQQMKQYTSAPAYSILNTCFDFGNLTSVSIPTISFVFSGNLRVDLHPSGILVAVSSTQACLAFAGNGDAGDVGIFGNTQQKTLEVVYDVAGGKLGFGGGGCN